MRPGLFRSRPMMLIAPALLSLAAGTGYAQDRTATDRMGTILNRVGFDQKLNAPLPLDLTFRDEADRPVRLGDYFGKRPVILTLVYYRCPMLCNQVLTGLKSSLKPLALEPGQDFDIVTVSIDPKEKPELARAKKASYVASYGRPVAKTGWHFLTGEEPDIRALAQAIGFRYTYNPVSGLFAHAAGIVIATPRGKVARYLYGIEYPARDVEFGLMEASAGKIGSPVANILLLCYDYDAATGKYTLAIVRLARVLGIATVVILATSVLLMLRRERQRAAAPDRPVAPSS